MEHEQLTWSQAPADDLIIDMRGIYKRFYIGQPNELEILRGIDLQVKKGEFLSIVRLRQIDADEYHRRA